MIVSLLSVAELIPTPFLNYYIPLGLTFSLDKCANLLVVKGKVISSGDVALPTEIIVTATSHVAK